MRLIELKRIVYLIGMMSLTIKEALIQKMEKRHWVIQTEKLNNGYIYMRMVLVTLGNTVYCK